jgi:uncharacterized protein YfaQ (DUF2300 family)
VRTVTLCNVLLWFSLTAISVQADDFDGKSMLFARLEMQAQKTLPQRPVFQYIDADGVRQAADTQTPLGSVWKLFVYAYAIDRDIPMPDYVCRGSGQVAKEELYCCDPGRSVSRDAALAQSCGLFFEPARLHLDAQDWHQYWTAKSPQVPWLADLEQLKPARRVRVSSLLMALASIDGVARERAEAALLAVMLNGRGQSALRYLGGRYRVKTFTWSHPQRPDSVVGGAAGWMSDGSAVWFGALGSSLQVMQDYAPQLAAVAAGAGDNETAAPRCVDVTLFARYPVERVRTLSPDVVLQPGVAQDLRGRFRIDFKNGKQVLLHSDNEIRLAWNAQSKPVLSARLSENEYIARVIDREGRASEREAARALSIVARTYLLQNATQHGECLAIADSSRTQRVSPNPASAAARDIAAFSSGLILQGANAQYRLNAEGKNVLSWKQAVANARGGMLYDEILQRNFEHASLASVNGEIECKPLPDAERWLLTQARRWRSALLSEPGFVELKPQVCQLAYGNPYSDMSRQRIYVRGLNGLNQRLTLAHEYLHLAFSGYPSGQDENYIEQWARRLIEGESRS